jgi:hypothetical protein
MRRGQGYPVYHLRGLVVPEPVLSRLEAGADSVASLRGMPGGVLARRTVAATDVSAFCAAAQMQPPSVRRKALNAAGSTWFRRWVDSRMALH